MTQLHPMRPDALPLRDALRGMRHVMRRGGDRFASTLLGTLVPTPVAGIADRLLRDGGTLAHRIDRMASTVARSMLVPVGLPFLSLAQIAGRDNAGADFAAICYDGLCHTMSRFGTDHVFICETAARLAYDRSPKKTGPDAAASLMQALIDNKVLRDIGPAASPPLSPAQIQVLAVFSVLLWMEAETEAGDGIAAIDAAIDLTLALADEVIHASDAQNGVRLAALFAEFSDHV